VTARGLQIGFVVYWLAFVLFTVHQGQYPGFFDRGPWSYPYWPVAWVCVLLTFFLSGLYLIVPAARFPYSRRRLGFAVAYAAALLLGCRVLDGTDQPAYFYVPLKFAAVTFVAVVALAVVSIVYKLNRRRSPA